MARGFRLDDGLAERLDKTFHGVFGYAGTSGFVAGSATSEDGAYDRDLADITAHTQRWALLLMYRNRGYGLVASELRNQKNFPKGGHASAALTNLYKEGLITVIADERRDRQQIYCLPQWVGNRDFIPYEPRAFRFETEEGIARATALANRLHDRGRSGDREVSLALKYLVRVSQEKGKRRKKS